MRIIIFSPFYPPHVGGLESHSDEFNKYLSADGVKIFVFTPQLPHNTPAAEKRHQEVEVLRFPAFELFHNYPLPKFWRPAFWHQWQSLSRIDCDLVISRTRFFYPSLMAWWYARKRKIPRVHVEHGSDFAKFNGRAKTWLAKIYDQIFGSFVLRTADMVIANSKASAAFVCTLAKQDSCLVIYRGVEKEKILAIAPLEKDAAFPKDVMLIGYVGRLIDGKGVGDLIGALAALSNKDFLCLIIGDGPEKAKLEKMVSRLHLEGKVRFLGHQPFDQVIRYMKIFDVFVNPSHTEGIPTAVIDAVLCKRALIATDVGGTREIITGNGDGLLVAPRDIAALKKGLETLLTHPELREKFGQKAFQAAQNKFSWKEASQKYMEIFESLVKK